jgi:hypothetical protein
MASWSNLIDFLLVNTNRIFMPRSPLFRKSALFKKVAFGHPSEHKRRRQEKSLNAIVKKAALSAKGSDTRGSDARELVDFHPLANLLPLQARSFDGSQKILRKPSAGHDTRLPPSETTACLRSQFLWNIQIFPSAVILNSSKLQFMSVFDSN